MYILKNGRWMLFAPDGGDGNGGHDDGDLPDKVAKAFEKLLDRKGGDASAVAMMLFTENKQYRDRINELTGKVPADGSVVLAGDDAAAWTAYRALGTPADVKTAIDERGQLQGKLDHMARETVIRDAASAAGYKFAVLQDRDKVARMDGKSLTYSVRETETNGGKTNVAYVKDGDTEQPLTDYAAANWAEFMPALVATPAQPNGTPFPAQHTGTGGNVRPTDVLTQFLQEQEAKNKAVVNPLLRT